MVKWDMVKEWCEFGHGGQSGLSTNKTSLVEFSLIFKITFAYLTYDDVQRIPYLKDQTVIIIKAPAETKLEVPHPEEVLFFFFLLFSWLQDLKQFYDFTATVEWFCCCTVPGHYIVTFVSS